jgi:hypothetical protein
LDTSHRQNFSEIIKELIQKGEVNFWLILYLYYFSLGVAASEQEEFQQQAIELYQIRRPLGLAFAISFWWLGELLPFYI